MFECFVVCYVFAFVGCFVCLLFWVLGVCCFMVGY